MDRNGFFKEKVGEQSVSRFDIQSELCGCCWLKKEEEEFLDFFVSASKFDFPGQREIQVPRGLKKSGRNSAGLPDIWRGVSKISLYYHAFLTRPPMKRLKNAGYY